MAQQEQWRVIGLWRVWDDVPEAVDPTERAPDALIEAVAGIFDRETSPTDVTRAILETGIALGSVFEEREELGSIVVGKAGWERIIGEGGWLNDLSRRHPIGGRHLRCVFGYGLDAGQTINGRGPAWAFATNTGPRIEDVAARFRSIGDAMGLPRVELGAEVPMFEERKIRRNDDRRQRQADR